MAIDTAAKRRSAASRKPILKAPIPDGTIDASDRAHIAWLYSGISILRYIAALSVSAYVNDRAIAALIDVGSMLTVNELVLKGSPILALPMQEGSGSLVEDISGYGNNGTITGATWSKLPSGIWYLHFDGTDDFVSIPLDSSFNFTTESFTCEMWVYPLAMAAYEDIISTGKRNVAGWCWEVRSNTGEFWIKSYHFFNKLLFYCSQHKR